MIPYFLLLISVLFFSYFTTAKYNEVSNLIWVIIILLLSLFSGFRNVSIGTDSYNYMLEFHRLHSFKLVLLSGEYAYSFLCWAINLFTNKYLYLFVFTSLLSVTCYITAIRKYSPIPFMSIFLFLTEGSYLLTFNILRQGIAISIIFLSMHSIFNKNFKHFILYVLVASLFHKSAIFILPTFFLIIIKNDIKSNIYIFLIGLFATLFLSSIFDLAWFIEKKYTIYESFRNESTGLVNSIFLSSLALFFMLFKHRIKINRKKYDVLLNMFLFGTSISVVSTIQGFGASGPSRVRLYFTISSLVLWPIVFQNLKKKEAPLFLMGFFSGYIIYFYMVLDNFGNLIPYKLNPIFL